MPSSRWERPPPPRDWRWVVGGVGKVLIATGLLMFGFVAYQLWGTGLEYAQAQDRLEEDFAELLATAPTASTDAPATTTVTTASPTTGTEVPSTDAAPPAGTAPGTTVASPPGPAVAAPVPAAGDVIALIEIPSIDLETYVVSGVEPNDLKKGPGHYPDTPQPGQLGNSAIAGHRTTYGQPFFSLEQVAPGDEIVITTVQGRFVYRATGSEVVTPDRSDVVATTESTVGRLTLTTCEPKYTARNRLVLYADLDAAASSAPARAPSAPPATSTAPAGTDDPVVTSGSSSPPGATSDTSTTAATTATTATPPSSATDATAPPTGSDDEIADAFAHGWFSDDAAFAQVALWGVVVSAIAVAAWLLSRRVRRNWIGALAGLVPFVLALYFFFQNVNRLLPAAL